MSHFPQIPDKLRSDFPPYFWNWWQQFKEFMLTKFETNGDVTMGTVAKGIVLTNADGTITKRIRLNDAGNGIIIEDV